MQRRAGNKEVLPPIKTRECGRSDEIDWVSVSNAAIHAVSLRKFKQSREQKRVGNCLSVLEPTDLEVEGWVEVEMRLA